MQDPLEKRAKLKTANEGWNRRFGGSSIPHLKNSRKLQERLGTMRFVPGLMHPMPPEIKCRATHRLTTINEVQQREIEACSYQEMRANWKEIADSQRDDVKLPDPTNGLNP